MSRTTDPEDANEFFSTQPKNIPFSASMYGRSVTKNCADLNTLIAHTGDEPLKHTIFVMVFQQSDSTDEVNMRLEPYVRLSELPPSLRDTVREAIVSLSNTEAPK